MKKKKKGQRDGAERIKILDIKLDDLRLITRAHIMEIETQLLQVVF